MVCTTIGVVGICASRGRGRTSFVTTGAAGRVASTAGEAGALVVRTGVGVGATTGVGWTAGAAGVGTVVTVGVGTAAATNKNN